MEHCNNKYRLMVTYINSSLHYLLSKMHQIRKKEKYFNYSFICYFLYFIFVLFFVILYLYNIFYLDFVFFMYRKNSRYKNKILKLTFFHF